MVGVAVVGAGNWGKNLVRNFALLDGVKLQYVCDRKAKVRQTMSQLYPQATVSDTPAAALKDAAVDAVVVAVEAPAHYPLAKAALEAGKHTFVEKPLTLSAAESQELVELAAARGVKLAVGHLLEYHPAVNYMKERIDGGEVGDPLYLYCQRVNLGIVRDTENAWWSLAPHDISVACYRFSAEPVSVSASGQAYLREGVEVHGRFVNVTDLRDCNYPAIYFHCEAGPASDDGVFSCRPCPAFADDFGGVAVERFHDFVAEWSDDG